MNKKALLGPIILRLSFFLLNLLFTIQVVSAVGWSFFAIILAVLATRDFVQGVRLAQVYYFINKGNGESKDK